MARMLFDCNYCGNHWDDVVTYFSELEKLKCSKCGDKDIKKTKYDTIDYYSSTIEPKDKIREK